MVWLRLVEQGRVKKLGKGLADVLIDTRYCIKWSNCLPYAPMDFICYPDLGK